jgi:hypothetical protein
VQFAASPEVFPPLLFDLRHDPQQVRNLCQEGDDGWEGLAWESTQELLQWRMRSAERTLSGQLVTPESGLVSARDSWR